MGHRTLVAYARHDDAGDRYDLHLAHWGVDPDALQPGSPFGGPPDEAWARERAGDLLDTEGGRLADDAATAIAPEPVATGLSFAEVSERVDPLEHEALYVVDSGFDVRTYLVVGLGVVDDGPVGALIGYEGESDAAYLRGWVAGARAVRDVQELAWVAVARALRWLDPTRGTAVVGGAER